MPNITIPNGFGQLASVFQSAPVVDDEFGAGISSGFAVMSYRGKVWRVKHRGEEKELKNERNEPAYSIEVVLVRSNPHLSKIFYENGYQPGSDAAPDCWSSNGVAPDLGVTKRQHTVCATCPKNQWGSKVSTDMQSKGKACSDSKRAVVVPANDIDNEMWGGPMLLRIPAASLQGLKTYSNAMKAAGFPVYGVATRIMFDSAKAHPELVFSGIRALTEEEALKVMALREDERTLRILNEEPEGAAVNTADGGAPDVKALFEQPPEPVTPSVSQRAKAQAPRPAPAPTPAPEPKAEAPKPAPKPAPAPVAAAPVVEDVVDAVLVDESEAEGETGTSFDALLEGLMGEPEDA